MKKINLSIIVLFFFLFSSWIGAYTLAEDQHGKKDRETVLDRKVHIEKDLILDVPRVSRWCDRLDLKKSRVNVGNCELYVEEEGKGLPVVLIHGGPGATHHYFHPNLSRAKD